MLRVPTLLIWLVLFAASAPAAAQIAQSPTAVSIRGERGSFSVTYRAREIAFEPGRGALCTEVRDMLTGQRIGPGQLSGRPVRCAGRILDRDPRPHTGGGRAGVRGLGECEPGARCEGRASEGLYEFRDHVRLGPGVAELAFDAVRESGQGVVYWVRRFRLSGFVAGVEEVEAGEIGIGVAVRPSGNSLTGNLAVLSADVYAVSASGGRINGAIRVEPDTEEARLQARLRSSGSGQIVVYWVVRRPGQGSDRSTWRRVSQATFRTVAAGRYLVEGPRIGDLPLNTPGRYDVSLHFTAGARDLESVEAPTVTIWRPAE